MWGVGSGKQAATGSTLATGHRQPRPQAGGQQAVRIKQLQVGMGWNRQEGRDGRNRKP